MKTTKAIAAMPLLPAAWAESAAPGWSDAFARIWLDSFKEHWRDTKEYTWAVFDAMPPDGFNTKPDPVQRTFGDQLRHLANVAYFNSFSLVLVPKTTLALSRLKSTHANMKI